jgi:sterol desaturase/sphingolipid hydroxylase (fatty acid hydroxylase superfamily)
MAGSPLSRLAWFKRKQQLHFVHHTHANSNFAIIDNFWDRLLGTYRNPDADDAENPHRMDGSDDQAKWSYAHSSALSDP